MRLSSAESPGLAKAHVTIFAQSAPETFFHPDFVCSDGKFGGKSAENLQLTYFFSCT
jgi:hypothetical protein